MKKTLLLSIVLAFFIVSCGSKKKVIKLSGPQVTANAKELMRITDDVVPEFQPSLSNDGKKLLYVIRDDSKRGSKRWSIRLKNNVMLPGFTPLIGEKTEQPSWIGDDGDFMFTYHATKPVIATSNTSRLGITYVGQNAFGDWDYYPRASPDGKKIVLTTGLQGNYSICLVNRDGSGFTVLSEGYGPKWHPNGQSILYSKMSGDYSQLFELDLNTYQSTQITTGNETHSYDGTYSPDGKHIAYIIAGKDGKYGHLFVMKRNSQSVTQLTSGDSNEAQPFWGNDGFIYFASTAGAKRPKKAKKVVKKKKKKNLKDKDLYNFSSFPYSDIWRVKPLIVK